MNEPSPVNILVVDDTLENLRLLSSMLGEQGYEVRPAPNGRIALQAAAHDLPDLILLDINMPDMNGYEVCAQLKQMEHVKDVPVVFLTALSDTEDKVRAFNAGGVDYITKPFQFEEVLARVKTHVALRRAQVALQQSYDRLISLEQLRDDLVHMVVHDMRSPLTVLRAHLDFLTEDVADALGEQASADLKAAVQGAVALTQMANDLLDVSRLEDGKMPLDRSECDLTTVAAAVRTELSVWDRTRTIEVTSNGPITVLCDAVLMRRVLENIVSNAIKHTPEGGRIAVTVSRTPSGIRAAVADEGRGVPLDARQQIFEKFGTVTARKERVYHSTGLGLAFCKLAVEAHGGSIGVDDGESGGSVFWFELPAS